MIFETTFLSTHSRWSFGHALSTTVYFIIIFIYKVMYEYKYCTAIQQVRVFTLFQHCKPFGGVNVETVLSRGARVIRTHDVDKSPHMPLFLRHIRS